MAATDIPRMIGDAALHAGYLLAPKPMAGRLDMAGRYVLVTGASQQSLGYEVARTLACWGAHVVVTCLGDPVSLQQALRDDLDKVGGSGSVTAQALDLADRDNVAAFVRWYRERFGDHLHVLVNNAGILKDVLSRWRAAEFSADGIEIHWRTNYLGTFHLTSLLLPMLIESGRASGDARVLNVTSHQHTRGRNERMFVTPERYNSWDAYGQSKLALIHLSTELHRRHGGTGEFRAVALHPGSAHTKMIEQGLASYAHLRGIRPLLGSVSRLVLLTPAQAAQTSLLCATDPSVEGGRYYERCALSRPSAAAMDGEAARRLWDMSLRWVAGG